MGEGGREGDEAGQEEAEQGGDMGGGWQAHPDSASGGKERVAGEPRRLLTASMEAVTGSGLVQRFDPIRRICMHFCA